MDVNIRKESNNDIAFPDRNIVNCLIARVFININFASISQNTGKVRLFPILENWAHFIALG